MTETPESSIRIYLNIPVYREDELKGVHDVDLSEIDRDDLISTRGEAEVPEETLQVQRETDEIGRFTMDIFIGLTDNPLSYLGLSALDDMSRLDVNQKSNLLTAYAPETDWKYDQWNDSLDEEIHIRGAAEDLLECAKRRAETKDEKDVEDILLIWESHPHFKSRDVRDALVEYDDAYADEFSDTDYHSPA